MCIKHLTSQNTKRYATVYSGRDKPNFQPYLEVRKPGPKQLFRMQQENRYLQRHGSRNGWRAGKAGP